jgi:hypothetical protein
MLALIDKATRKIAAQRELERSLKGALELQGVHNIGFPGGNVDLPIYTDGEGKLWVAFGGPIVGAAEAAPDPDPGGRPRRYWNAFGVYQPEQRAQSPTVEINIPIDRNRGPAGFFAEDTETGNIFLMHSGKVGGGRPGISKSEFLAWSKAKLIEVSHENGGIRKGIAVGKLHDTDLANRIWAFVRSVQTFKEQARPPAP